jgi:hypothetical protein
LLRKWNYDDAHTRELPLMTTAPNSAKVAPSALPGSRAVRALPTLGVTSVRERKSEAGRFWSALTKSPASSPVAKVYLVGRLKPTLDVSVPQVGAPAAWAAGFTGKGATVGVVDTGVDANHPDLKGVVTDAKDFTGSEFGTKDEVGHGTHVAGTIAGRGTASNGRYTGVAKGAEIKSAKVCQLFGCPERAVPDERHRWLHRGRVPLQRRAPIVHAAAEVDDAVEQGRLRAGLPARHRRRVPHRRRSDRRRTAGQFSRADRAGQQHRHRQHDSGEGRPDHRHQQASRRPR